MTRASEPAGGVSARPAGNGPTGALAPRDPGTTGSTAGRPDAPETRGRRSAAPGTRRWQDGHLVTMLFLAPALVTLAAVVVYPIGATVWYSLYNRRGEFVGVDNYVEIFTNGDTFTALVNNLIWVLVAPTLITAVGLVFAVLTERIKFATAFKTVMFMPMAISMLAVGVTFTLVYKADTSNTGALNALIVTIHDTFKPASKYTGAEPRDEQGLAVVDGAVQTVQSVEAGTLLRFPLTGLDSENLPGGSAPAAAPDPGPGVRGTVWLDLVYGGGGSPGVIDAAEKGLPDVIVEALSGGRVVASTTTDAAGRFSFPELADGSYTLRLSADNFREPYNGEKWLSGNLVTPSIILAYIWMWAGFAMVLISAGLAAIPREALEAARVDGATEWQVFRRVTIPLVRPVLIVVFVTLMINVLKIFDLILILAPDGLSQEKANVIALQMFNAAFRDNDYGLGSALSVILFVLVLPAMLYNIRKLRRDQ